LDRSGISKNSEIRAQQVTNTQYKATCLGADLHKKSVTLTRIIDHAAPQPAQGACRNLKTQHLSMNENFSGAAAPLVGGALANPDCTKY
jgi:hypothetical protein